MHSNYFSNGRVRHMRDFVNRKFGREEQASNTEIEIVDYEIEDGGEVEMIEGVKNER